MIGNRTSGKGLGATGSSTASSWLPCQRPVLTVTATKGSSRSSHDIGPPTNVCAVILGGGELDSKRMFPLTERRTLPAIPLCGNYRLIDIPVSNCINSGLFKIYVLTQFNSTSLNRYLTRTYDFSQGVPIFGGEGFMEVVAAQQSPNSQRWADGPADNVRQWMSLLDGSAKGRAIEDILILPSDQIYRIDLARFVAEHRKHNADISIVSHVVPESRASQFGILNFDDDLAITSFEEKPSNPETLQSLAMPWQSIDMAFASTVSTDDEDIPIASLSAAPPQQPSPKYFKSKAINGLASERQFVGSCGIYLMKAKVMKQLLLSNPGARTFSRDIIPPAIQQGMRVRAFPLKSFFDDIGGSVKDYYNFSIGIAKGEIPFSFIDPISPVFSCPAILPPNFLEDVKMKGVQLGSGCSILRSTITNSVIGARSKIREGCFITDSVLMGADYYENETLPTPDVPAIGIGANCQIHRAIIDKNARIGSNVKLLNKEGIVESDRIKRGIWIRDGLIVVAKSVTVEDGTVV